MALCDCPDCKVTFSDTSSSCPKCGFTPFIRRYRRFFVLTIAVCWAVLTTSTPIFGQAFLSLLHQGAILVLYTSVLALLVPKGLFVKY